MEHRLDLKDKKILAELDFNARMNISALAKKLRISRPIVAYRIKNLERNNYILGYTAIVNAVKQGFYYCRALFKFEGINKEVQQKILESCSDDPKVGWLGILDGYWDLGICYWVKDLTEFESLLSDFIYKFGKYIFDKEISIGLHVWQFQHRYLLNKEETEEFETGGKIEEIKIDKIDKKLLTTFIENARTPVVVLAAKLELTPKAVIYRIKNLMKKKVLLGFRAQINYNKLNYCNNKVFLYLQNLKKDDEKKLVFYIKHLPNCIYITKPLGKADLEFEVLTKDREEFFLVMQELKEKFGNFIRNYDKCVIHKEIISRFARLE